MDQTVTLDIYEAAAIKGALSLRREQLENDLEELKANALDPSSVTCYDGALALLDKASSKIKNVNLATGRLTD